MPRLGRNFKEILVSIDFLVPFQVLHELIKSRGKTQMRFLKLQLSAMEKLVSCPDSQYDLIIDENRIDKACEQLANFLEIYWRATHPIDEKSDSNKN